MTVVIPAFNEADLVAATIQAARRLPGVAEVIVVDDGSSDATAARAREAGARVLSSGANQGKGAALTAGVAAARGGALLFLDADLGPTAGEAAALLGALAAGADMAVARFPRQQHAGGLGLVRRLAQWGIRCLTGRHMEAPLSGQRALTRAALQAALPLAPGFGVEVGLTLDVLRAGLEVVEVETAMQHRLTGRRPADFCHRGRQLRDVAITVLRRWRRAGIASGRRRRPGWRES